MVSLSNSFADDCSTCNVTIRHSNVPGVCDFTTNKLTSNVFENGSTFFSQNNHANS